MNELTSPTRALLVGGAVHLYTSIGTLFGFMAMAAVAASEAQKVFLLFFAILLVDYTDGSLARALRVDVVVPRIDGERLDYLVDFFTNVILPAYFMWSFKLLPKPANVWTVLVVLISLYRFSQRSNPWIKDGFLRGLPSPWIPLTFYFYYGQLTDILKTLILLMLLALTLTPTRYIHIARLPRFRSLNIAMLTLWWILYLAIVLGWLHPSRLYLVASLAQPVTYFLLSWLLHLDRRRGALEQQVLPDLQDSVR